MLPLEPKYPGKSSTGSTVGAWETAVGFRKLNLEPPMRIRYLLEVAAAVPVLACFCYWAAATLMATVRGRARRCPRCDCARTRWSRVRFGEQLLPAFVMPRRCESCHNRFFAARSVNYARRSRTAPVMPATAPQREPATGFVTAALQGNLR